jgi:uncharacterized protein (DUF2267 family)
MRIARTTLRVAGAGATAVGLRQLVKPGTRGRRVVVDLTRQASRQLRHLSGQLDGLAYRLASRHPATDVPDDVLADRLRSELGPVQKSLDLPRVIVHVDDGVASLYGEVGTEEEAETLEHAARRVVGIVDVEASLHIGLSPDRIRPSEGRATAPDSEARRRLLEAGHDAGLDPPIAGAAVRAVLTSFVARLPEGERAHVLAHLPEDARELVALPRRAATTVSRIRTRSELADEIQRRAPELDELQIRAVLPVVLAVLAELIPEERSDIAAVLPPELRELWRSVAPVR